MQAHRESATISAGGKLSLEVEGLEFPEGCRVDVIVVPAEPASDLGPPYPGPPASLRGSVLRYDRPHDPAVDPQEFDAVRGVLGSES